MAERVFRVLSLGFLSVGFLVAVAGADRNGPQDLANATNDLILHVSDAKDTDHLNATVQSNKGISLTTPTGYLDSPQLAQNAPDPIEGSNPSPSTNKK